MARYTSQTISGYNSTPPPDDGSTTAANEVKWATHINKIGNPLRTLAQGINSELANFDGKVFPVSTSSQSTNYTVQASDNGKTILASNTITVTLLPAATAGTDFITVIKNAGSGVITIDGDGSETIDGESTIVLISPNDSVTLVSDASNWYVVSSDIRGSASTFTLPGDISPSQITSNQNNYNPTDLNKASVLRLDTDASRNLTGLQGGWDGRTIVIHNVGSNDLVLTDEDSNSTAANRFSLAGDLTLSADQSAIIQYDATSSRWRSLTSQGTSSGWEFVSSSTASASATVSFTGFESGYDYMVTLDKIIPATDAVQFQYQLGISGPTYRTTGYETAVGAVLSTGSAVAHVASTAFFLCDNGQPQGNATDEFLHGHIIILDPEGSGKTASFGVVGYQTNGGDFVNGTNSGQYNTAEAHDAIQFFYSSGNIASGVFKLYRRANA